MIGMILCGGYGKRLRPITDSIPKPMVEIKSGYTLIDRQIFDFAASGVKKAVLLTGYLGDKIEEYLGREKFGVELVYVREEEPRGTLNAIRMATEIIDCEEKTLIIRNGDVITDINLRKMIEYSKMHRNRMTMFVTRMKSPFGIVELGEKYVMAFREKPLLDIYINGGIYVIPSFSEDIFMHYESGDIEKTVFPELSRRGELLYYKEDNIFWIAVDTTKELETLRKEYSDRTDKPWGYEKVLISTEKYLTKELYIREGYRTSMHYHSEKDETMYVISGSGYIEYEDGHKDSFGRNDTIRIKPGVAHTIVATENLLLHEVSTPHLNDTVRVRDYYSIRMEGDKGY